MNVSRLTQKYQTTVPTKIRQFLDLHHGDTVSFEIKDGKVLLKKIMPLDLEFMSALEKTLPEWSSPEDDEAFNDL